MTERFYDEQIEGLIVNSVTGPDVDNTDPKNPKLPQFVLKSVYDLAMANKANIDGSNTVGGVWYQDTILSDLFPNYKQVIRVLGGQMAIEYGNVELDVHRFVVTSVSGLKVKVGSAEYTVYHTGNFNPDDKADTDGSNATGALDTTIANSHTHANKSIIDSITAQDIISWDDAVALSHSHQNKALLDTYNQTNANITDAVNKRHDAVTLGTQQNGLQLIGQQLQLLMASAVQNGAMSAADYNKLTALAGLQLEADQANALIRIKDGNGVVLSTLNVAFLNNEGTTFIYNPTTNTLDLTNDYGQILSSIPVSSFVTNLVSNANWNGTTPTKVDFKDNAGTVLFSIDYTIANIQGLQAALDNRVINSENAYALGFHLGTDYEQPYILHNDGTYAYLATRNWANNRFSLLGHTHPISEVIGLQTALDGKANTSGYYSGLSVGSADNATKWNGETYNNNGNLNPNYFMTAQNGEWSYTSIVQVQSILGINTSWNLQQVTNNGNSTTNSINVNGLLLNNFELRNDTPIQFYFNNGLPQKIYTGGLLASDSYADASLIPANGIYSKGNILSGATITASQFVANNGGLIINGTGGVNANTTKIFFNNPSASIGWAISQGVNGSTQERLSFGHWDGTYSNLVFIDNDSNIVTNNYGSSSEWNAKVSQSQLANYALLSQVYTQAQSLSLFVGLNGVQTIADTKTFTSSPVVPNGTLSGHTVNLGQMQSYVTGLGYQAASQVTTIVNNAISAIPAPGNGSVILQGIGSLTGTATFLMNQANNTVGSFDLTPTAKNEIAAGATAGLQIVGLFGDCQNYFDHVDVSAGGTIDVNETFYNLLDPHGAQPTVNVTNHHVHGARLILHSYNGVGSVKYIGEFVIEDSHYSEVNPENGQKMEFTWNEESQVWIYVLPN